MWIACCLEYRITVPGFTSGLCGEITSLHSFTINFDVSRLGSLTLESRDIGTLQLWRYIRRWWGIFLEVMVLKPCNPNWQPLPRPHWSATRFMPCCHVAGSVPFRALCRACMRYKSNWGLSKCLWGCGFVIQGSCWISKDSQLKSGHTLQKHTFKSLLEDSPLSEDLNYPPSSLQHALPLPSWTRRKCRCKTPNCEPTSQTVRFC